METYFDHYVLAGGWAMLFLIPASVVTIGAAFRALLALRLDALAGERNDSSAARVAARLRELHERHGTVSADDIRAEVDGEALRLFALLQPISAMAALAPLAGILGSVTSLMAANNEAARRGSADFLPALVERALIPTMWGLGIALLATACYTALRARLYYCERRWLRPAAERAADDLLGRTAFAGAGSPSWKRSRLHDRSDDLREEAPDGDS